MSDLTPKQEAFCLAYIETGNASEAYRQAYDTQASAKTIHEKASRLLAEGKVRARLGELQQKNAEASGITVERITKMLADAYDLAMDNQVQAPAAAVSAALGLAKLHGHLVEKKHVIADHQHTHVQKSVSETAEWIRGVIRERAKSLPKGSLQN